MSREGVVVERPTELAAEESAAASNASNALTRSAHALQDVAAGRRVRAIAIVVCCAALLFLPVYLKNQFYLRMAIDALIFIPLVVGQNVITGNSGQVAMGHAAFYGTGAYVTAILTVDHGWGTVLAILASVVITAFVGLATGLPAIRVSGDYLFIVTIGLNLIFLDVVTQWTGFTGGASGIPGVPLPSPFGIELLTQDRFYYLALAAAALSVVVALLLVHSRFGKTVEAVRDDPTAALASGMSLVRTRIIVFSVGAGMAGMSGSILAFQLGFVGPQSFQFLVSLLIFEMAIIGGLGNVVGSIVGAALLVILPEALRSVQDYRVGIGGVAILILMVLRPQGLIGSVRMTSLARR
jgi:branched-chain amino acid transport system permease protein